MAGMERFGGEVNGGESHRTAQIGAARQVRSGSAEKGAARMGGDGSRKVRQVWTGEEWRSPDRRGKVRNGRLGLE